MISISQESDEQNLQKKKIISPLMLFDKQPLISGRMASLSPDLTRKRYRNSSENLSSIHLFVEAVVFIFNWFR